jgi:hypothetical protein
MRFHGAGGDDKDAVCFGRPKFSDWSGQRNYTINQSIGRIVDRLGDWCEIAGGLCNFKVSTRNGQLGPDRRRISCGPVRAFKRD